MGRTILVADDSAAIQKKASGILAGEGLEVFTVSNGVAAIKKLTSLKPLLVLADVSMPGKDGYEVCEFVKTSAELSYIPVLLLVSDMEPYDEHRGAKVRANGMVQKPFDPETLISMVTKFVAQAEAAVAQTQVAETVINAPPPAAEFSMDTLPEEEEVPPSRGEGLDWGALPEGSAFGEPAQYEASIAPPEQTLVMGGPPILPQEAAPELAASMEAPADSFVAEASYAEPAPAEYAAAEPAAAPEATYAVPEASYAEPAPVEYSTAEPVAEAAPVPSEPVFIEEAPPVVAEHTHEAAPEMTMMFRAPVEIAEPVLTDEVAPAPVEAPPEAVEPEAAPVAAEPEVAQAPVAEPEVAPTPEEIPAPVESAPAAESEAVPVPEIAVSPAVEEESAPPAEEPMASPVEAAPPAEEIVSEAAEAERPAAEAQPAEEVVPESVETSPVAEAQPAEPAVAPAVAAPVLNAEWIYWIVRSVVVKMSPPALSNETIEEVARKLTDEISAELASYTSQH